MKFFVQHIYIPLKVQMWKKLGDTLYNLVRTVTQDFGSNLIIFSDHLPRFSIV